jgi:hypothetical protein
MTNTAPRDPLSAADREHAQHGLAHELRGVSDRTPPPRWHAQPNSHLNGPSSAVPGSMPCRSATSSASVSAQLPHQGASGCLLNKPALSDARLTRRDGDAATSNSGFLDNATPAHSARHFDRRGSDTPGAHTTRVEPGSGNMLEMRAGNRPKCAALRRHADPRSCTTTDPRRRAPGTAPVHLPPAVGAYPWPDEGLGDDWLSPQDPVRSEPHLPPAGPRSRWPLHPRPARSPRRSWSFT